MGRTAGQKPIFVKCGCCKGTGRMELSGIYLETLNLLRGQRSEVNGAELAKFAGCSNEAMCNRLVAIEKHGFAVGRRYGRERFWRAK